MDDHDVTFENGQARERTQVLMDIANQCGGLVVGTGDLSELALGWATYNGDHMSMYGVNACIPKTLVRHLVAYVAGDKAEEDPSLSTCWRTSWTPPSPPSCSPPWAGRSPRRPRTWWGPTSSTTSSSTTPSAGASRPGRCSAWRSTPWADRYDRATILKWLKNFYRRFFAQQFKRSCLPDGPKVGSVTLSPRGDWRMPSDAVAALWMAELEELQ